MEKFFVLILVTIVAFCAASHHDNPTDEAFDGPKLSVCEAYKAQFAEPKPKKAVCNVKCEIFKTVKCSLPELQIPECNEYAAYVYKRILADFNVMDGATDFKCELPTSKDHKAKQKPAPKNSHSAKISRFCGEYKNQAVKGDFEFPCFVKCDSYIVGVSLDGLKPDWELTCEVYQHACTLGTSNTPMNVGTVCEAFRQYVMQKVKLGEIDYHHCNVYNHGPQFDYFNGTVH